MARPTFSRSVPSFFSFIFGYRVSFFFFFQIPFGLTDLIDRDPVRFGLDRVVWFASPEAVILFNESGGLPGFCFFFTEFLFCCCAARDLRPTKVAFRVCVFLYFENEKKETTKCYRVSLLADGDF